MCQFCTVLSTGVRVPDLRQCAWLLWNVLDWLFFKKTWSNSYRVTQNSVLKQGPVKAEFAARTGFSSGPHFRACPLHWEGNSAAHTSRNSSTSSKHTGEVTQTLSGLLQQSHSSCSKGPLNVWLDLKWVNCSRVGFFGGWCGGHSFALTFQAPLGESLTEVMVKAVHQKHQARDFLFGFEDRC